MIILIESLTFFDERIKIFDERLYFFVFLWHVINER